MTIYNCNLIVASLRLQSPLHIGCSTIHHLICCWLSFHSLHTNFICFFSSYIWLVDCHIAIDAILTKCSLTILMPFDCCFMLSLFTLPTVFNMSLSVALQVKFTFNLTHSVPVHSIYMSIYCPFMLIASFRSCLLLFPAIWLEGCSLCLCFTSLLS